MTPRSPGGSAAIGAFHVTGDIGHAMSLLDIPEVAVGEVRLRRFADIDRGVVARPAHDALLLMPHAGPAVIRRIESWLESRGLARDTADDPRTLYPEASSLVEARMLHALSRAASPLAIDLLLDQPRRWSLADPSMESDPVLLTRSAILNRLIDPPTVVALGPPNIGKSTLLNTLAGRSVSIVADEPGTTRDHVGVRLDLAGLVVNYLDTPGIDPAGPGARDDIQRDAQRLALTAVAAADLVLLFADPASAFVAMQAPETIRLGLRCDLGTTPGASLCISARTGDGIDTLVAALRERLVPMSALSDPGPWRFW